MIKFAPQPPRTVPPTYLFDGPGPDPRREILYFWPAGEVPDADIIAKAEACMDDVNGNAKPFYFPDTGKFYYIDDCGTDEDGEFHIFGIEWR